MPEPPAQVSRFQVRVELVGSEPTVWRRLELDGDLRLDVVHRLLQEAMGWEDYHLHAFRPPGRRRHFLQAFDLEEGDEGPAEVDVRLDQVLHEAGDRLEYEYDFGDGWDHLLTVESVVPRPAGGPAARCLAGAGAALDPLAARLTPALAELASRLPLPERRRLLGLVAEALVGAEAGDDAVTDAAIAAPWGLLLDLLGPDGVALSKAGYLPPATVLPLFEGLGLDQEWIGRGNREDLTPPITSFREAARDLGLVRVHRGRLVPTRKALAARDRPAQLRALVVAALPLGKHPFQQQAGELCLLLAAAGRLDRDTATVAARLLESAGWSQAGKPLERWAVSDSMHLTRTVLDRTPDPTARRALARSALGLNREA